MPKPTPQRSVSAPALSDARFQQLLSRANEFFEKAEHEAAEASVPSRAERAHAKQAEEKRLRKQVITDILATMQRYGISPKDLA